MLRSRRGLIRRQSPSFAASQDKSQRSDQLLSYAAQLSHRQRNRHHSEWVVGRSFVTVNDGQHELTAKTSNDETILESVTRRPSAFRTCLRGRLRKRNRIRTRKCLPCREQIGLS